MNKHPDDPNKHGAIVTLDEPQLPAVIKKTKNPWKKFSVLDRLADEITGQYQILLKVEWEILDRKPGDEVQVGWIEANLVNDEIRQKLARCRELMQQLDGPENYDEADDDIDDDEPILKKLVISARLAAMMAGVHIGGPKEDEQVVFAKMLLSHVYDAQVSRLVLESACREIERTKKYMQATSEVLDVLNEQRGVWQRRRDAIDDIERRSKDVQETLLEALQDYEHEASEAKQKEAKAAHGRAQQKFREKMLYLNHAENAARKKQEEASVAYKAVQTAMEDIVRCEQAWEQARIELTIAFNRVEQLNPPKKDRDNEEAKPDARSCDP